MLLLGIDIGTSSIKVSVVDVLTHKAVCSINYPQDREREIMTPFPDWAEQDPSIWWSDVKEAIKIANSSGKYNSSEIKAIGITYQMHGLVLVDKNKKLLRNSIIWCDSRAVVQGEKALKKLGEDYCYQHLLNFPGNFTASKLAWVKENEPDIYAQIDKVMLPGDYISLLLTGKLTATISMLSEGIFWDFKNDTISDKVIQAFGIDKRLFGEIVPLFSHHGAVTKEAAEELGIPEGISVSYKAGDQPNNALSLNVFEPGEIATTAGTSGVIYAVSDQLIFDEASRINSFAHVNYHSDAKRIGVLLCINGTGICNRWIKNITRPEISYSQMDAMAYDIPVGADGLFFLPFGNGSERILENKQIGAHFYNLNLNVHQSAHLYRAVHEGIAFAFRYGLDIIHENGLKPKVVKAGKANMFLNKTFTQAFVNATGLTLELYETDGSAGAALGAGIGDGIYKSPREALSKLNLLDTITTDDTREHYETLYQQWKKILETNLTNIINH